MLKRASFSSRGEKVRNAEVGCIGRLNFVVSKFRHVEAHTVGTQQALDLDPRNAEVGCIGRLNFVVSKFRHVEARFNMTKFAYNEIESSNTTNFGIPRIEIESLLRSDRIRFGANQSEATPGIFSEKTMEFRDIVSNVRGNHGQKRGGEFRRDFNNNTLNGAARPLYPSASLFNFANDTPLFYQINANPQTGGPANAQRHFRSNSYGVFVQ